MSFPKYEAYKDSGVEWLGEVPNHWIVAPLKYKSTCNDKALPETTPDDYEIEYIEISDVDEVKGITASTSYAFDKAPSRARRVVQKGDVLVSTVRTYLRAIAPVVQLTSNLVASTGFAVIRPTDAGITEGYLGYLLRAEWWIAEVISKSVGVSYPAINSTDLVNIKVPVPQPCEQTQIASFLDYETSRIDVLIAEQERLIALLKEKRQAVISHAVTKGCDPSVPMKDSGVEWLGEVPNDWKIAKVKHVVQKFEQGWSPQCENVPVEDERQWGVLKVGCVNGGSFSVKENKRLPESLEPLPELSLKSGDVLISRANTRDLVGSSALVNSDHSNLMISDKLFRLRTTNRMLPEYLVFYLGTNSVRYHIELEATGASSSMLNIGQSVIKELYIPVPPFAEQSSIADQLNIDLSTLQRLRREAKATQNLLQERRSALISAAVTGKIDVRNWQPPANIHSNATSAANHHQPL